MARIHGITTEKTTPTEDECTKKMSCQDLRKQDWGYGSVVEHLPSI
jgi:hypothetical protein